MKKNLFIIILLLSYLFGCSKTHEEYLKEASSYYNKKEYSKAIVLYEKACEKGSFKACMLLADIYKNGEIVEINQNKIDNFYKNAFILTEKYCIQNDKDACKILGSLYEKGNGVNIDLNKADNATIKACELGDDISCYRIAKIKADNINDFILYNDKACKLNMAYACLVIGNTYITGFNESMAEIEKNIEKGIKYISEACKINNELCVNLADIYISGDNLEQNYEKAIQYYEVAIKYYEPLCKNDSNENTACKNIKIIKSKFSLL